MRFVRAMCVCGALLIARGQINHKTHKHTHLCVWPGNRTAATTHTHTTMAEAFNVPFKSETATDCDTYIYIYTIEAIIYDLRNGASVGFCEKYTIKTSINNCIGCKLQHTGCQYRNNCIYKFNVKIYIVKVNINHTWIMRFYISFAQINKKFQSAFPRNASPNIIRNSWAPVVFSIIPFTWPTRDAPPRADTLSYFRRAWWCALPFWK